MKHLKIDGCGGCPFFYDGYVCDFSPNPSKSSVNSGADSYDKPPEDCPLRDNPILVRLDIECDHDFGGSGGEIYASSNCLKCRTPWSERGG